MFVYKYLCHRILVNPSTSVTFLDPMCCLTGFGALYKTFSSFGRAPLECLQGAVLVPLCTSIDNNNNNSNNLFRMTISHTLLNVTMLQLLIVFYKYCNALIKLLGKD